MNHLRKLALLSSLALSFSVAVQADGTLPLPLPVGANKALPMEMAADTEDMTLRVEYMAPTSSSQLKALSAEPCGKFSDYYVATGNLIRKVGTQSSKMNVRGVCKPQTPLGVETVSRTVVAQAPSPATGFVLLTGTLETEQVVDPATGNTVPSTVSFSGSFGSPSGAEAGNTFTLYRVK
jgi:hypothetical protein